MADITTKRRREDALRERGKKEQKRIADAVAKGRKAPVPNPHEPLWQQLGERAYLGFRPTSGAWIARYGEQGPGGGRKGKIHSHALIDGNGAAIVGDNYIGAKKAAEEWLAQVSSSGASSIKRGTVRDALDAYLADLREHGREDAATEAEGRFKTTVDGDPIGNVSLESLTKEAFRMWRKRLMDSKRRENKKPEPRSVNRQVRGVVAGLNYAVTELSHVGNPASWTIKALPDDTEDGGETAVFLDAGQRKALFAAAEPFAAKFFAGLECTGARPKELALALVRDFNGEALRLSHRKGRGSKLKTRYVTLDAKGVKLFAELAEGRSQGAHLFTEDGQTQWRRHVWARRIRAAIGAVNKAAKNAAERVPEDASAYSFRHARISELLQIHEIDPLTVAHQTGTSLAMLERAYFRFIPSAMRDKMEGLKS